MAFATPTQSSLPFLIPMAHGTPHRHRPKNHTPSRIFYTCSYHYCFSVMDDRHRKKLSTVNALGGSTARPCDSCLRRRARWYCGADEAFLCQSCDATVHSANSLAGRHQRLRIHTASSSSLSSPQPFSWHKRKARTPRAYRQPKQPVTPSKSDPVVPDLEIEDEDEFEMQLLCRVPVLDPDFADFCSSLETKLPPPSIEKLDVESLFGAGLDEGLFMKGFSGVNEEEDLSRIKMGFDLDSIGDEMELYGKLQDGVASPTEAEKHKEGDGCEVMKKIGLRLDYDAVINACSQSGCSPWAGGDRPRFYSDGCWPAAFMCISEGGRRWRASRGEGREARVTRYKEKRRTRLFSKKIRYEVRKLNAEKRPRMKGRFIKRTNLSDVSGGPTVPYKY